MPKEKILEEAILAGFGGQGILLMGQLIAYAGILENREVCWLPSYGPEMRGGTANCTVIISDEPVSSPIINQYTTLVAFNLPSLKRFEQAVFPQGSIIWNSTQISDPPRRTDLLSVPVPADDIATEMGNPRLLNMIMLGAYFEVTKIVKQESLMEAMRKLFPRHLHRALPQNEEAIKRGMEMAKKAMVVKV
jgi:2-oxoglutarate ferredoxin oxidoreductase subunit gamma